MYFAFHLGSRFSSQKQNLQPLTHCTYVHDPGPDKNQDSPSQLNNFDERSDSEVVLKVEEVEAGILQLSSSLRC